MFKYYLMKVLLFGGFELSMYHITSECFFFIGLIVLNILMKQFERKWFIKSVTTIYLMASISLVFLIQFLDSNKESSGLLYPVLTFVGIYSFTFEVYIIPIMVVFLEICPPNLEGFFMSLFSFINNYSKALSSFLASLLIFALDLKSKKKGDIIILVFSNVLICFIGLLFIIVSKIPEPENKISKAEYFEKEYIFGSNNESMILTKIDGENFKNENGKEINFEKDSKDNLNNTI